jgi:hypothetical protein
MERHGREWHGMAWRLGVTRLFTVILVRLGAIGIPNKNTGKEQNRLFTYTTILDSDKQTGTRKRSASYKYRPHPRILPLTNSRW